MSDDDFARRWGALSDNQRLYLVNAVVPRERQVRQSQFIHAINSLLRMGLLGESLGGRKMVPGVREMTEWAIEHGYASYTDGTWVFTRPHLSPGRPRINLAQLIELAEAGYTGAEISRKLGVTREAVRQAANRAGIVLARAGAHRGASVRVPFTSDEMDSVMAVAERCQESVATYVRQVVLRAVRDASVVETA